MFACDSFILADLSDTQEGRTGKLQEGSKTV